MGAGLGGGEVEQKGKGGRDEGGLRSHRVQRGWLVAVAGGWWRTLSFFAKSRAVV